MLLLEWSETGKSNNVVMGTADSCLYIEHECKTEDNYPILGSQTPVVCLCIRPKV